jgi:hypothetical protein
MPLWLTDRHHKGGNHKKTTFTRCSTALLSTIFSFFSTESTNQMQQNSQVYYLSFKYSSTCFGHPHAHHQELQQLQ